MDPFLEAAGLWPDFHHNFITEIQRQLNATLRPRYHARIEDRVFVYDDTGDIATRIPDVTVVPAMRRHVATSPSASGTITEPIEITELIDDEVREASLAIIDARDRRVVAVIEVMSPSNKSPGSPGRELYGRKRREVLQSQAHWIEIDLLLRGQPFFPRELAPACHYLVHASRRTTQRRRTLIWPIRLQDALPTIGIPLTGDEPPAHLDLQAALTAAYEGSALEADIDYSADPVPLFPRGVAEWVTERLRR